MAMKLAYDESAEALNTRIRAHLEYSSLKIEDVISEFLSRTRVRRVLDVGCGSGNYTPLFAKAAAAYVGVDKGEDLLAQAAKTSREEGFDNPLFMRWDMNHGFPFVTESFDFVFFGYSAYYVDDVRALMRATFNVLQPGGTLCIVGPMAGNAVELDRLGERLLGIAASQEKEARLQRLEREFVPAVREIFGNADVVTKDFSLVFPTAAEYRRYYLATPQLLELASTRQRPSDESIDAAIESETALRLTKRSLFIWAKKN